MSSAVSTARGTSYNTFLLVPIMLFFALLTVAVLRAPEPGDELGHRCAVIVVAPLILSTFALMAMVIAGARRSISRSGR